MNQTALDLQQTALRAAFVLNSELLPDNSTCNYSGSKEDFDRIYQECLFIAREELSDEAVIDQICDLFWDYQMEIMNGHRQVEYYLY